MKATESPAIAKLSELFKSVWTLPFCLAFLKLWLTSHLPMMASSAPHDNLRYVIMAANLLQPDVTYDRYALMRQPGYPAFIAFSYLLGFSLRFSQELLYLVAGFFLAWSFHKYYRHKLVTILFLSLYILAPGSFHWNRQTLQESLYLPLISIIFSCLIHLIKVELNSPNFLKWSAVLGLGMGWFWNTRPEGVAILPSVILAYGIVLVKNHLYNPDNPHPKEWGYTNKARLSAKRRLRQRGLKKGLGKIRAIGDFLIAWGQAWGQARGPAPTVGAGPRACPLQPCKLKPNRTKYLIFSISLVAVPIIIITFSFSLSNHLKYGLFSPTDLDSPAIKATYSRLTSVSPERWKYLVAVPRETRLEIYAASPTFRQLSGYLEGEKSRGWSQASCAEASICDDYASGWFFWALRDAVADAGQYKSAAATEAFYWQIAREVEAACQSGQLNCKDRRFSLSSFAPDLRREYVLPFFKTIGTLSSNLIHCSSILNLGSGEEDYQLRKTYFEKVTRESANFILQRQQPINQIKDKLIILLSEIYKFVFPILIGMGTIGIGWEVMRWRVSVREIPFSILWLLFSCIIIRVLLFAYIDATSYPVGSGCRYLRPVLPLVWLCVAIAASYLTKRFSKRRDMLN